MSYDTAGRPTGKTVSDTGASYTLGYDSVGNLSSVTDQANRTASRSYDAANRLTGETDVWGHRQTITRDAAGNITAVADGEKTVQYGYGTGSRLLSVTDGVGRTTRYSYDDRGRPFETVRGDTLKTVVTYDGVGRVLTVADPVNPQNGALRYSYDSRGNITATQGPGGSETYGYDVLDRLVSWTDQAGAITRYSYDAAGNLTGKGAASYSHDPAGQITNPGCGFQALLNSAPTSSPYAYARNQPLTQVDQDGRWPRGTGKWVNRVAIGASFAVCVAASVGACP